MTEEIIHKKIEELYNYFMDKPMKVYEIFCNFFGEEFVDIQGFPSFEDFKVFITDNYSKETVMNDKNIGSSGFSNIFILVRFPEVRVTNENDKYIDIWELYAKVAININGTAREIFRLNRSKYNNFQFKNNYLHSHISGIYKEDLTIFQIPCLGEGPIRDTIALLLTEFDELRWELFCLELSKYVTVESLNGGPYHKLENLGKNTLLKCNNNWHSRHLTYDNTATSTLFTKIQIKDFIKYVIERNQFSFNYIDSYGINTSYINWIIFLSNEFINWVNDRIESGFIDVDYFELLDNKVLRKGIIKDGDIYVLKDIVNSNLSSYIGRKICTFKGEDVLLEITDMLSSVDNYSNFIDSILAEIIYKSIVQVINFEYGNKRKEELIRDDKKVLYI